MVSFRVLGCWNISKEVVDVCLLSDFLGVY